MGGYAPNQVGTRFLNREFWRLRKAGELGSIGTGLEGIADREAFALTVFDSSH